MPPWSPFFALIEDFFVDDDDDDVVVVATAAIFVVTDERICKRETVSRYDEDNDSDASSDIAVRTATEEACTGTVASKECIDSDCKLLDNLPLCRRFIRRCRSLAANGGCFPTDDVCGAWSNISALLLVLLIMLLV